MLKKRITVILLAIGLAMLAGLVPIIVAVWFAYYYATFNAEERLYNVAQRLSDDTSEIFHELQQSLDLAYEVSNECTDADIKTLQRIVFNVPEVSEIGVANPQRELVCTSWGKVDPPIKFSEPLPNQPFTISGPIDVAIMQQPAIVASHSRADGSEVNALILPKVLVGLMGANLGKAGFAALYQLQNASILASSTEVPALIQIQDQSWLSDNVTTFIAQFVDGIDRRVVGVKLDGYTNILAIAAADDDWILGDWKELAVILGLAGLIVSTLLIVIIVVIARRRLSLTAELQRALYHQQLEVYYQPVIDLETYRCVGAEVLLRWQHTEQGLINPDLFIALAEKTGLIIPMTEWLLHKVAQEMGPLLRKDPSFHLAINLCSRHFEDKAILETTATIFKQASIRHEQITYELTERGLIAENTALAREIMLAFKQRGSHVALDDFGTGYSSLRYIASFPLSHLKIDKQFVDAIGTDAVTAGLVDAIITMAGNLNLAIVAEGVENKQQEAYLRERGVQLVQGWLYGRPMSAEQFWQYLARELNE